MSKKRDYCGEIETKIVTKQIVYKKQLNSVFK